MILNSISIVLTFLILSLSSCSSPSSSPKSKQCVRLNIHTDPPSLDPRVTNDATSCTILKMCFEGLTRLDKQGEPHLALAESVTLSSDQKTYYFVLKDASWSDGTPVSSRDFEMSWKTILDPNFPSNFSLDLYLIKNARKAKEAECPLSDIGIKTPDNKTLIVELEHPAPYFLKQLASHSFLPTPTHLTKQFPNWAQTSDMKHFACCGPFRLSHWKHHNKILLSKNPHYWDASKVQLEEIHLFIVEDENTELVMYENSELDWAGSPLSNLPADALGSLSKNDQYNSYQIAGTYYYIFNTKVFPFNHVKLRKAFALAIDRKAIVENVTQGGQTPATGLVPLYMWKKDVSYFQDADLKEARRLFKEALQEMHLAQLPPITLTYNTLQSHHKIAQAIQEQWLRAFGIRVRLENKEWKVFTEEIFRGQFQIARMGGVADFDDPSSFLDVYRFEKGVRNYPNWHNPLFTQLLQQAEDCLDQRERLNILQAAERVFIDEMPIAPIYFYTGSYLKKPYVKGVTLTHLNDIDFKTAYIQQ